MKGGSGSATRREEQRGEGPRDRFFVCSNSSRKIRCYGISTSSHFSSITKIITRKGGFFANESAIPVLLPFPPCFSPLRHCFLLLIGLLFLKIAAFYQICTSPYSLHLSSPTPSCVVAGVLFVDRTHQSLHVSFNFLRWQ